MQRPDSYLRRERSVGATEEKSVASAFIPSPKTCGRLVSTLSGSSVSGTMSGGRRDKGAARLRVVPTIPGDPSLARTPAPPDDSQLLGAVRSGDKSAAAAFYDRVRPQIDRTLMRLFGKRDTDHDDLR